MELQSPQWVAGLRLARNTMSVSPHGHKRTLDDLSSRGPAKQPINKREAAGGEGMNSRGRFVLISIEKKMFYILENYNFEGNLLLNLFLTALLKILYH